MQDANRTMLDGYAYVPIQRADMRNIYDPEAGLERGTIFPTLDLPLGVYGNQIMREESAENE